MPRIDYQSGLARDNAAAALRSRRDRDVAEDWPSPGDRARRDSCERDLRRFLETYFPGAFRLAWSSDHLRAIERLQEAILAGGLYALAAPRGDGKTTRTVRAAIWATLYGHRRFVCLVGATERAAISLLKHVKAELLHNEALGADFRDVCYPLRRLEGHARKAIGQLCDGVPTRIEWGADKLTYPTVPTARREGLDVGGSTISVSGITGALRGQSTTLADGTILRPDLVLLDDPQTRESALSASQCADRLETVNGDVLGMGGPGVKIAALACLTVIREGDLADVLLDRERSPRWHGERCRLLDSLPENDDLWERYARIRAASLRAGGSGAEATEFYATHRDAMDAGASAAWPARHLDDEVSAIQHAMNLKLDDEASFMAEYQNSPAPRDAGGLEVLTPEAIATKTSGVPRGELPLAVEHLTMSVDVHDSLLYWVVAGWSSTFDGWVVDHGTWPDQRLRYVTLRKAPRTLARRYPGTGREGSIRAGLVELTDQMLSRDWPREDGAATRIGRCLVDAGYLPEVVVDVCRHSQHAAVLLPSRGVGIGAAARPISEYDRTKGDRIGHHWYVPRVTDRRASRHIRFDSNYWKSFVHARLATAIGDPGSLSLHGRDPDEHRLLADHLTAESPIRTSGQGRTLDEWRSRPDRPDNHFFDCLAGSAVAASFSGAVLPGSGADGGAPARRRVVSFAELQRRRQRESTTRPRP